MKDPDRMRPVRSGICTCMPARARKESRSDSFTNYIRSHQKAVLVVWEAVAEAGVRIHQDIPGVHTRSPGLCPGLCPDPVRGLFRVRIHGLFRVRIRGLFHVHSHMFRFFLCRIRGHIRSRSVRCSSIKVTESRSNCS